MAAKTLKAREEIASEHKWDLIPLFESDDTWESLFRQAEETIDRYQTLQRAYG